MTSRVLSIFVVTSAFAATIAATPPTLGQRGATPSTRPNFSGVWTGIPASTPEPARPPDGLVATIDWSSPVTLKQDETTLTVDYRTYSRSHAQRTFVYKLDGTETANILTGAVDPMGRTSTAVWDGQTLILTDAVDWPLRTGTGTSVTTQKRRDIKALSFESPGVLRVDVKLTIDNRSATRVVRFRPAAPRPDR